MSDRLPEHLGRAQQQRGRAVLMPDLPAHRALDCIVVAGSWLRRNRRNALCRAWLTEDTVLR